jgi:hypothetical protein
MNKQRAAAIAVFVATSLCSTFCRAETNTSATASQFVKEVGKENFKKAEPPSAAPVFLLDFSKDKVVHTYSYQQEVRIKTDMGQEMSAKGLLLIKSQGDSTAELVLKDMKISMKSEDEPKTMEQQMPPFAVQGMKEDGSGSFGNSSQDMVLKMLFPLPPKPIKVGESVDVPAQMPFDAMGSVLNATGRSRITLTQYVTIDGRTCAQLDVDTDISKLEVPSELKGEYRCSTKGTSVFYFDVADRSFVSGTIALIMQFSIDAPMPQMNIPGEDTSDMPKRSKMSMGSDNLIKVKLKK